jgi:tetratricopeptide (TPR) repeat protein
MALADVAEANKDKRALRAAFESAHAFDPGQSEPLKGLFDLAKEEKRDADALEILRRLAPLEQHDRQIWKLLLERLVDAKRWDEAARAGESAIYVDVLSPAVHTLYARALEELGEHEAAVFELESALACAPPAKEAAAVHVLLARASLALGKKDDARRHRSEAQRLDPENEGAKELKIP